MSWRKSRRVLVFCSFSLHLLTVTNWSNLSLALILHFLTSKFISYARDFFFTTFPSTKGVDGWPCTWWWWLLQNTIAVYFWLRNHPMDRHLNILPLTGLWNSVKSIFSIWICAVDNITVWISDLTISFLQIHLLQDAQSSGGSCKADIEWWCSFVWRNSTLYECVLLLSGGTRVWSHWNLWSRNCLQWYVEWSCQCILKRNVVLLLKFVYILYLYNFFKIVQIILTMEISLKL